MNGDEYAVLSAEQQKELEQKKVEMRLENERYLRSHPELKKLVSAYMRALLEAKPDSPEEFAGTFFCDPGLRKMILNEQG